ncbi:MAG: M3 family metallopeptidase, partial [Candidatus Thorarchaeota archaeon]
MRKYSYKLSNKEEEIILEKDRVGIKEWSQLQNRWLSLKKFNVTIHNNSETVNWSNGLSLTADKDKKVRKEAIMNVMGGLEQDQELFARCLRNICANHVYESKRRGYPSFMESSLIENDISQNIVDNLLIEVESHLSLFHKFLQLKAKIMGTKKLLGEDYEAPIPFDEEQSKTWDQAQKEVIEIYSNFHPEIGKLTEEIFNNKRIDAEPRQGKRPGAFTAFWYGGKSTFSMLSYNGKIADVKTLTHEMGHAIHGHLLASNQSFFNFYPTVVMAETASEFGTMLFLDHFLASKTSKEQEKYSLFIIVEKIINEIFEVASRTRFEQYLYEAVDNNELLNAEKINDLFWKARKKYFDDFVEWMPEQVY